MNEENRDNPPNNISDQNGKKEKLEKMSFEEALQSKLTFEKKLLGQDLESDERTVLDCFEKPRLILERVQIIFNQTLQAMGKDLMSQEDIRKILGSLERKGYIRVETFEYNDEEKEAFILTEEGKQLV